MNETTKPTPSARPSLSVATAADSKFFPGLLVALATAIEAASGRFDYRIVIIDGGILDSEWNLLSGLLTPLATAKRITINLERRPTSDPIFETFPSSRGSRLTWARLALPFLFSDSQFIYLDSDVLCLRGLEEFWQPQDSESALVAVADPLRECGRDRALRARLPRDVWNSPYFNAGIVGLNCGHWRNHGYLDQISRLLSETADFPYRDQSLLNLLFHDQWTRIPVENNLVLSLENSNSLPQLRSPANLHFVGPSKPWFSRTSRFYRFLPDLLWDEHFNRLTQAKSNLGPRQYDLRSLNRANRKAVFYKLVAPKRSKVYREAVTITKSAATLLRQIAF